jgi:outer membrane usher protein
MSANRTTRPVKNIAKMYASTVYRPKISTLALALVVGGMLSWQLDAWAVSASAPSKAVNSDDILLAQADLSRPATGALASRAIQENLRVLPLEVTINGTPAGQWVFIERDGILFATDETFEEWRVNRRTTAQAIDYRNEKWFSLASVPGYQQGNINFATNTVALEFAGQSFSATRITTDTTKRPVLSMPELSAFLNYDINANHVATKDIANSTNVGALLELGVSGPQGVFTSSHVAKDLTHTSATNERKFVRLESTFNKNFTDSNTSLRIGDSSTRSGISGRSVYFGGLQIGRNFALSPGFTTQPMPLVSGTSSAPSTVELYVNDVLRQTSKVPTGPFVIDNFPVISAAGDARVVVRDVLGRETVLTVPFFAHADLLEEGLSDWSAELGAVRKNFGTASNEYGERFASGLYRFGLNKKLTLEANSQIGTEHKAVGLGASFALPAQLLGRAGATVSDTAGLGTGHQWLLGVEQVNLTDGFTLRAQGASRNYRTLGDTTSTNTTQQQLSASYRREINKDHAFGLGLAHVKTYDNGNVATASANYTWRLESRSAITFNASRAITDNNLLASSTGNRNITRIGFSWSIPLDGQINVNTNVIHQNGNTDAYAAASKNLSADTGVGWRVLGGTREGDAFSEGGLYYQGTKGLVTADVAVAQKQQAMRVGAQGGVVLIDGKVFPSRTVTESYALVHVPGYADVGVGFHGDRLNNTDAQGYALVTRLTPFVNNNIRLNAEELPIGAEIESIEQSVVPPQRSGVKVVFPVRSGQAALLKIVFDDGEAAPAGAVIKIEGDKQEFYVARRGEAFVTGLQATNNMTLSWKDTQCTVSLTVPQSTSKDEIVRVGPISCKGVKR